MAETLADPVWNKVYKAYNYMMHWEEINIEKLQEFKKQHFSISKHTEVFRKIVISIDVNSKSIKQLKGVNASQLV